MNRREFLLASAAALVPLPALAEEIAPLPAPAMLDEINAALAAMWETCSLKPTFIYAPPSHPNCRCTP